MGRHNLYVRRWYSAYNDGPRSADPYHCAWGSVVGDRIRRLRTARGLTLEKLSGAVYKPEGGHYSAGYFSRIERGWASAPLYTYLAIADVLGVDPGRLLGPDDAQRDPTTAESMLLRFLREMEIEPEELIVRLARREAATPPAPP